MTPHVMRRTTLLAGLAVVGLAPAGAVAETLSHGNFRNVDVQRPAGPVRQFVLLLANDTPIAAARPGGAASAPAGTGAGAKGSTAARPGTATATARPGASAKGGTGAAAAASSTTVAAALPPPPPPPPSEATLRLTRALTGAGAMVARIDLAQWYAGVNDGPDTCTFPDGSLENLAHHVQAQFKLPTYLTPLLVGRGAGAPLAVALVAQTPPSTFAGVLTLDFCPQLPLAKPLCKGEGTHFRRRADGRGLDLLPAARLAVPWFALQNGPTGIGCDASDAAAFATRAGATVVTSPGTDWLPPLRSAFSQLASRQTGLQAPPASLADLPIVEVVAAAGTAAPAPAASGAATVGSGRFAVLLSGDGGWAGIDKGVAAALAARDLPVVGFDSLRYFWSARTPDGLATDLDRVIRYYAARWKRPEAVLIGYSQGADVLPFAVNRLPAATRGRVVHVVLLGPGQKASFEFHVTNWIGPSGDRPIRPEAERLDAADTSCVFGADEKDSLCPEIAPRHARALKLAGGHHFGGDWDQLAALLLQQLPPR